MKRRRLQHRHAAAVNVFQNGLAAHVGELILTIRAREEPESWILEVRNNGIGIESQYYERIFVMFQRLHGRNEFSGTGIGLAICQRIVNRLGGKIWLESQVNEGSTFFLSVPKRLGMQEEGAKNREYHHRTLAKVY